MIANRVANAIKFRYVLTEGWFAVRENFEFILKKGKHFISAQKYCCLLALTGGKQEKDDLYGSVSWNCRIIKRCAFG
jgi:hypothetical protein